MSQRGPRPSRYGRIPRTKDPLEEEADRILAGELKDKSSNKAKKSGILSDSQLARRQRKELPFSDLSIKDRLKYGLGVEEEDN